MKKKAPDYLTLKIPVDDLREHAVAHVFDSIVDCSPEVMPSVDLIIARFDEYIRDPKDLVYEMETEILDKLDQFFEGYEDEYIQEILNQNENLSQAKQDKLRSSGLAKLTPEERAALGLACRS